MHRAAVVRCASILASSGNGARFKKGCTPILKMQSGPVIPQPSPELEKALRLINYVTGNRPRPPQLRRSQAQFVGGKQVTDETARKLYAELLTLRGGVLFKDEADLLEAIAQRLGEPLRWRIGHFERGPVSGAYQLEYEEASDGYRNQIQES